LSAEVTPDGKVKFTKAVNRFDLSFSLKVILIAVEFLLFDTRQALFESFYLFVLYYFGLDDVSFRFIISSFRFIDFFFVLLISGLMGH